MIRRIIYKEQAVVDFTSSFLFYFLSTKKLEKWVNFK